MQKKKLQNCLMIMTFHLKRYQYQYIFLLIGTTQTIYRKYNFLLALESSVDYDCLTCR